LVRALVLRLVSDTDGSFSVVPGGDEPPRGPGRFRFATMAQLAKKALDNIEPDWPTLEGARRAVPGLIAHLAAAQPNQRRAALVTLDLVDRTWPGRAEARSVIPGLIVRLADPPNGPGGGGFTADGLAVLGRVDPRWQHCAEARVAAPALLRRLHPQERGADKQAAPGVDPAEARWTVVDTLARLGETAADIAPGLRALLGDPDRTVRCQALAALASAAPLWGQTHWGQQAFEDLLDLLGDGRGDGAALALRTLNRLAPLSPPDRPAAVRRLVLALPRDDVLETLGKFDPDWRRSVGARRAVADLGARFRRGEAAGRVVTAWVLAQLGDGAAAAVPELIAALADNQKIESALGQPFQDWVGEQGRATVNQAALRALEEIDPNWPRRPEAKQAEGELVRLLLGLDSLEPAPGEAEAVKALDRIRPDWRRSAVARDAVAGLAERLTSEEPDQRRRSLVALGRFGPEALEQLGPQAESTRTRLVLLRADPWARVRDAARARLDLLVPDWAKSAAGARAVPLLVDQLAGEDAGVRAAAAEVLAQSDPKLLHEVMRGVPGLVHRLVSPGVGERLIKICTDDSQTVRDVALAVLEDVDPRWRDSPQGKELFGQLVKQLESGMDHERRTAAETLGRLAPLPEGVLQVLVKLVGSTDRDDAALAAATVLGRHGARLPGGVAREVGRIAGQLADKASLSELVILRALGPAAAAAVPPLIEDLGEDPALTDDVVRTLDALAKQHWREAAKVKEMLPQWAERAADKDSSRHTQGVAALVVIGPLGERGPLARQAIDGLVRDLTPREPPRRRRETFDRHSVEAAAAARALGNIGTAAAAAVGPLLERLTMPLYRPWVTPQERAEFEAVWEALGRVNPHWPETPAGKRALTLWREVADDDSSDVARVRARLCRDWLKRLDKAPKRPKRP
jgi:hypothetical protein